MRLEEDHSALDQKVGLVKEVELLDVDGDVNIMFRLRNKNVPSALKQTVSDNTKQNIISSLAQMAISPFAKPLIDLGKRQLAKNLTPGGYRQYPYSTMERVQNALLGERDEQHERFTKEPAGRERRDLLSLMMTGKQQHNTLPISTYKPSNSEDKDTTYYSSPETEKHILEALNRDKEGTLNKFSRSRKLSKDSTPTYRGYGFDPHSGAPNVLGKYTMQLGEDEKGKYVSYYDKWDLNPYQFEMRKNNELLDKITTNAQYLANVKPQEVYGRVYYEID